ncbi:DUF2537 domain-containing protein [Gordonia pseudamarae]|uniref:DUF2537 domain-containing protein n=1 Tax=Gordonia pseudamarae TaxID=2831662 RepID=A0ABX6IEY7_9ACTN|nr:MULTISPECIES: DUF2537 domain-containing protein [Gordonia]MBD0023640.1 DUF2537 domain-containing protein [Gordonia sp. (in: high G+C Gram-positive bacteria)]QHN25452.1 DUF2537 domain-containing protein [Gordonia pseudamarae]QHN34384.1 DUF2537 domain-containing protein [Gordonia pseudamarae]
MTPRPPGQAEATPWGLGVLVTVVLAVFSACLLVGINDLLGDIRWWLGWLAMAIVACGIAWTLWDLRMLPVWRWLVGGSYVGMLSGLGSGVVLTFIPH